MSGTGYFSKFHTKIVVGIHEVELVAICGTSIEKAATMTEELPFAKAYDNVFKMLDVERLDAVYICVPPMQN